MIRRLLLLALVAAPMGAAGQSPPTLDQVDSLIVVGHSEEARTALSAWWERANAQASPIAQKRIPIDRVQMQHAIWLRAVLTVDPTQAAIDYQRLVVEFPGGLFTDRALLRLAQLAEARGDAAKAREHLTQLIRDYPSSATQADAARLLRTVEALPEAQAPPLRPATAPATATAEPAPVRPAAAPNAPPATAPSAPARDSIVLPRAVAGSWTVQLGAFASPERARALGAEIAAGGSEIRIVVVPPSRLIRVRTGRFLSQGAAEGLRGTLVARGLEATVAGDADREEAAK